MPLAIMQILSFLYIHRHCGPICVITPMPDMHYKIHGQRISSRLVNLLRFIFFNVSDNLIESESLYFKYLTSNIKYQIQVPVHSTTAPLQKIRKEIAILEEAVAEDDRLAAIGRIKKLQVSGKSGVHVGGDLT